MKPSNVTADNIAVRKDIDLLTLVKKLIPIGVLLFFLQVPALKDIYKYLPYPLACSVAVFLLSGVMYYGLLFTEIGKPILQSKYFSIALILLVAFAGLIIYPYANARSSFGGGSTADDAIIEPINSLLNGRGLYDVNIGVPVSPGPGWILINIPFAFRFSIFLMTPAYLAMLTLFHHKFLGDYTTVNRILVAFLSSMLFWDLAVTGYDHFNIGIAFLVLVMTINKMRLSRNHVITTALLCGVVATARVVFLPFGLLTGALLFRRNKRSGIVFAALSIGFALLLNTFFFCVSAIYQPLHLFGKTNSNTGLMPIIIATIVLLMTGIPLLLKSTTCFPDWLFTVLVLMGIPLSVVAWGELNTYRYQFELWEGAHYLFLLAPLAIAATFYRFPHRTGEQYTRSR